MKLTYYNSHSGICFMLMATVWKLSKNRGGSRIFLGVGALVSCCTSTPINQIVFLFFCRIPVVLENRRSSRGGGVRTPCTLPLDPPLKKCQTYELTARATLMHWQICLVGAVLFYFVPNPCRISNIKGQIFKRSLASV